MITDAAHYNRELAQYARNLRNYVFMIMWWAFTDAVDNLAIKHRIVYGVASSIVVVLFAYIARNEHKAAHRYDRKALEVLCSPHHSR